jgi:hypothetical protein
MKARITILLAVVAIGTARVSAFEATGEVSFRTRVGFAGGAAYDQDRIVGPGVDLVRAEGGRWAGTIGGGHAQLWPTADGIAGDAIVSDLPSGKITLHFERSNKGTAVRGLYFNAMAHLEIGAKTISGRVGDCSVDLTRKAPGLFEGAVGCVSRGSTMPSVTKGILRLGRDAAKLDAPMPQLALALLAVLPR